MLSWENGYGAMLLGQGLCRERQWIVNMAASGLDGVLVSLMCRIGLVYGNLSGRVGGNLELFSLACFKDPDNL